MSDERAPDEIMVDEEGNLAEIYDMRDNPEDASGIFIYATNIETAVARGDGQTMVVLTFTSGFGKHAPLGLSAKSFRGMVGGFQRIVDMLEESGL